MDYEGTFFFVEIDMLDADMDAWVEVGLRRFEDYLVAHAAFQRFEQEDA
jgi:hypothetical protein